MATENSEVLRAVRLLSMSLIGAVNMTSSQGPAAALFDVKSSRKFLGERLEGLWTAIKKEKTEVELSGMRRLQGHVGSVAAPLVTMLRMGNAGEMGGEGKNTCIVTTSHRAQVLQCLASLFGAVDLSLALEEPSTAGALRELVQVAIMPLLQLKQRVQTGREQSSSSVRKSLPENVKLATCAALESMALSCAVSDDDSGGQGMRFVTEDESTLACLFGSFLDLAELEQSREVQVAALSTLLASVAAIELQGSSGRRTLFGFLPGISVTIHRLLIRDYKHGSSVTRAACLLWKALLLATVRDSFFPVLLAPYSSALSPEEALAGLHAGGLPLASSGEEEAWLQPTQAALPRLQSLLHSVYEKLARVDQDADWKYVEAVTELCAELLQAGGLASQHLHPSQEAGVPSDTVTQELLRCLMLCVNHSFEHVRQISVSAVKGFVEASASTAEPLLARSLSSLLDSECIDVEATLDAEKLAYVRLLHNHILVLEDRAQDVLYDKLELLLAFLCELLQFDSVVSLEMASEGLVHVGKGSETAEGEKGADDAASRLLEKLRAIRIASQKVDSQNLGIPSRAYRHFSSRSIETAVMDLCGALATHGDLFQLADNLLEIVRREAHPYKPQALFLLNSTLALSQNEGVALHERILEEYLAMGGLQGVGQKKKGKKRLHKQPGFHFTSSADADAVVTSVTTTAAQEECARESLETTLLLEGLGIVALHIGPDFSIHLIESLYPVLRLLGEGEAAVSRWAWSTLQRFAAACEYATVEDLLAQNVDYLVDKVCMEMRHLQLYPRAPQALVGILFYSDVSILPMLSDAVESILSGLDQHNSRLTPLLVKALQAVALLLHRIQQHEEFAELFKTPTLPTSNAEQDSGEDGHEEAPEKIVDVTDEDPADLRALGERNREEEEEEATMEEEGGEEAQAPVPQPIELVQKIMRKMQHFLATELALRQVALDILLLCTRVLGKGYQKQLLPLTHEVWPALRRRMIEKDVATRRKCFEVLQALAVTCGDYFRDKFQREIWPVLKDTIAKETLTLGEHMLRTNTTASQRDKYAHEPSFKLLVSALTALAVLGEHTQPIALSVAQEIFRVLTPFLHERHLPALTSLGRAAVAVLVQQHADACWLLLFSLLPKRELWAEGEPYLVNLQLPVMTAGTFWRAVQQKRRVASKGRWSFLDISEQLVQDVSEGCYAASAQALLVRLEECDEARMAEDLAREVEAPFLVA